MLIKIILIISSIVIIAGASWWAMAKWDEELEDYENMESR